MGPYAGSTLFQISDSLCLLLAPPPTSTVQQVLVAIGHTSPTTQYGSFYNLPINYWSFFIPIEWQLLLPRRITVRSYATRRPDSAARLRNLGNCRTQTKQRQVQQEGICIFLAGKYTCTKNHCHRIGRIYLGWNDENVRKIISKQSLS